VIVLTCFLPVVQGANGVAYLKVGEISFSLAPVPSCLASAVQ
jgi:hypothetical protein